MNNEELKSPGSIQDEEKEVYAMSFLVFTMTDPRAKALLESGATAYTVLQFYKDRAYLDTNTENQ